MNLYGKEWTRRALEGRLGRIEQVGGLRRTQSTEGRESGVEEIQIRTGAGLSYSSCLHVAWISGWPSLAVFRSAGFRQTVSFIRPFSMTGVPAGCARPRAACS